VLQIYLLVLALLAVAGGGAGVAIAVLLIHAVLPYLASVLPVLAEHTELGAPPLLLAFWYGALIAYLFSMPALLSALNIRPSHCSITPGPGTCVSSRT
jgi:hypothetical protein